MDYNEKVENRVGGVNNPYNGIVLSNPIKRLGFDCKGIITLCQIISSTALFVTMSVVCDTRTDTLSGGIESISASSPPEVPKIFYPNLLFLNHKG